MVQVNHLPGSHEHIDNSRKESKMSDKIKNLPDTIKVVAPLVNGEQYLRSLPFPARGPYSDGYGGCLYAITTKVAVIKAYNRARGRKRLAIELAVGVISYDEFVASF
jgi:hypothetical protein